MDKRIMSKYEKTNLNECLNSLKREVYVNTLSVQKVDLLIIGGGITGVGIALDAASRGLKTALIEMQDYAEGTSSRSTKLIHGGLRYLKQFEFKLVADVGRERAIVYKNARHIVTPEKMLLPIVKKGTFGRISTSFGLWFYDLLANVSGSEKRQMLSRDEALKIEPLLESPDFLGAGYYTEYRTDDARLTIEVAKTAVNKGAVLLNYVKALDFVKTNGKVTGVICEDMLTNNKINIKASIVVNASGPWVDKLRKADGSLSVKRLHLTKGVHVVVDQHKLPIRQSVYFDLPDGRMMFAIPRDKITYIGTTDTNFSSESMTPIPEKEDINYILNGVNYVFKGIQLTHSDIKSSWAGLRPLIHEDGKNPSELSRKDEILESESGLISIAGGKLTGYRKMAEQVVNLVCNRLNIKSKCITKDIVLSGAFFDNANQINMFREEIINLLRENGIQDAYIGKYLVACYGKNASQIVNSCLSGDKSESGLLEAEVNYCVSQEGIVNAVDYLVRRSGKVFFNIDKVKIERVTVISIMKAKFNWSDSEEIEQNKLIDKALNEAQIYSV